MKRNLILIGTAVLLSVGSWFYVYNVKAAQAAAKQEAMKSDCCATKATAGTEKGCCETKK